MIRRETASDGAIVVRWERGDYRVASPAPGFVAGRLVGYGTEEVAEAIIQDFTPLFPEGKKTHLFADWYEMTGYDSRARFVLTDWMLDLRPRVGECHFLVKSRLVAMGVAVANIALGGLFRITSDKAAYRRAHDAALGRARRGAPAR